MYADEDLLMLSGVQHYAYCPRQWALIHLEQQWESNSLTLEGDYLHTRADNPECRDAVRGVRTLRAMPLVSYDLGLRGISDIVEMRDATSANSIIDATSGQRFTPFPVEYKHGSPKQEDCDRLQLCAQGMCIEEMYGITISEGALYYGQTKHRETVHFSSALRTDVATLCQKMHTTFNMRILPRIFANARCKQCSLHDLCLPPNKQCNMSVTNYLKELYNA